MFFAEECLAGLSFPDVLARPEPLAYPSLASASQGAWRDGLARLILPGPPGVPGLAGVHARVVVSCQDRFVVALRWVAIWPGGGPFPVLDANITLTPAGEQATRLRLAGVCRAPAAALGAGPGQAVFRRAARAATRSLLSRVADDLARPPARANGCEKPGNSPHGTG